MHESVLSRRTSPVSPGKMGTICRGVVPSNTKKATSWAVRVFEEWRQERNATATGEQCPLELLEKLTGCRSVMLPSPRHEQPKMSPYSPLQMVPIFPGETGEVNLRFAGDFFFTSGLQQRHTEQNGSPRQDALEHISIDIILPGLETAHIQRRATRVAPFRTFEREQQANHVGLQAHSRRHESSRVILLSSYYLQVVVEVCHQLLVSSLADIPAVGSENWQNSTSFSHIAGCPPVSNPGSIISMT